MIKKASIIALLICLWLTLLSPGVVQAKSGLTILNNSTQAEFPTKLSFNLSVEGDVNITDIRLHYTVDQMSFARVTSEVYINFEPATSVDAKWTWDMRMAGGLPPGSNVDYWWTVEDTSGNNVKTAPVQVQFDDNRYPWRSVTENKVTLYWYEGEESFARELLVAAQQALARLAADTGAELDKPVKIYIYASTGDLQDAMISPREWTGGVTFTRYGIIAIGISPSNRQWGKRAIAHELAHVVTNQVTFNPYSGLPIWLSEGLAMYAEGELAPESRSYLNKAIAEGSLLSVRSLSSPFSAYAGESYLSYAQSYSLVEFLVSSYGQGKMLELLETFKQGSSYDGALEKTYGFDMDGLDGRWRNYVAVLTQPVGEEGMSPVIIGVIAGLATALLLVLGLVAESWAWRRGW